MDYSWAYAKINLWCFSQTILPLLPCGWLRLRLFGQEARLSTVMAAGTKHCLKWFVLHFGGRSWRCSSAASVDHRDNVRCCMGYRCVSPHPPLCWCLQAILSHPNCRSTEGPHFLFSFFPAALESCLTVPSRHTTSKRGVQLLILTWSQSPWMHALTRSLLHMLKTWACSTC